MKRVEFMTELAVLLQDISAEERMSAMRYYNEFFDDAGIKDEDEVTVKIGSPKELAEEIKAGLKDGAEGETNAFALADVADSKEEESLDSSAALEAEKKKKKKTRMIVIGVIVAVLALLLLAAGICGRALRFLVFEYGNRAQVEEEFSTTPGADTGANAGTDAGADTGTNAGADFYVGVEELDIEVHGIKLCIVESDEEGIRVENRLTGQNHKLTVIQKGEELEVTVRGGKKWEMGDNVDGELIVHLPKKEYREIHISHGAGILEAQGISCIDLEVDLGAGTGELKAFQTKELDISCGAGMIVADGDFETEGKIECGAGEVTLQLAGQETAYDYEVECGMGDLSIGNTSFSGVGTEKKIHNGNGRCLEIECGLGKVQVSFAK